MMTWPVCERLSQEDPKFEVCLDSKSSRAAWAICFKIKSKMRSRDLAQWQCSYLVCLKPSDQSLVSQNKTMTMTTTTTTTNYWFLICLSELTYSFRISQEISDPLKAVWGLFP